MVIVDSCGWLEWFVDGKLADQYEKYLADPAQFLIPTIILYEAYNMLKRKSRRGQGAVCYRIYEKVGRHPARGDPCCGRGGYCITESSCLCRCNHHCIGKGL